MTETTLGAAMGDVSAAIEAGKRLGNPKIVAHGDSLFIAVPKDFELKELPYAAGRPSNLRADVATGSVESFVDYFKRFATQHSLVFANLVTGEFKGVLDYHRQHQGDQPITPDYCQHLVRYDAPETPEWLAWKKMNGKDQTQDEFAQFIEDMAPDIIEPDAATMLETASTLQASTKVNFRRAVRLDNGETQFSYVEQIDGAAGQEGRLSIPTLISLGIQLHRGRARYQMEARFRYRLRDGALKLRYELVRPERAVEAATREIVDQIRGAIAPNLVIER